MAGVPESSCVQHVERLCRRHVPPKMLWRLMASYGVLRQRSKHERPMLCYLYGPLSSTLAVLRTKLKSHLCRFGLESSDAGTHLPHSDARVQMKPVYQEQQR
jgi:hypothetical protein